MIAINKVGEESIGIIKNLAHIIWPVAYASIITEEQIKYMLDLFYTESSLQKQIIEGNQFIVAFDKDEAIGFASYSSKTNYLYRLHKLYVHPNQQGKGTGKILIDFIINDIQPKGATALELNVNRYNKAVGFYLKNGFTVFKEQMLEIGKGYFMDDYIMIKQL